MNSIAPPKLVHVRSYTRARFGRREDVREHFRSWPNQLSFGF